MRSVVLASLVLLGAVEAQAAQIKFVTDSTSVVCPPSQSNCAVQPLPLGVSITVTDDAIARGRILAEDVLTYAVTEPWDVVFPVAGVPGWNFNGTEANYFLNGDDGVGPYGATRYAISGLYGNGGWQIFTSWSTDRQSFELLNTTGHLESDNEGCTVSGACRVVGHWEVPTPVPEPSALVLVAAALGGLVRSRRRPSTAP